MSFKDNLFAPDEGQVIELDGFGKVRVPSLSPELALRFVEASKGTMADQRPNFELLRAVILDPDTGEPLLAEDDLEKFNKLPLHRSAKIIKRVSDALKSQIDVELAEKN